MSDDIRALRVMNDYGVRLPIWAFNDEEGLFLPRDLFVDPLHSELLAWAAEFDNGFDPISGWGTVEELERHCKTGKALASAVRDVLPQDIPVTCDIWELMVNGTSYVEQEDGSFRPLRSGEDPQPIRVVLGETNGPSPWDPLEGV